MFVDQTKVKTFDKPKAFNDWLASNHKKSDELWIKIYKKSSNIKTIDWNQAVIEALCWGWIDGIKKSLDSESYLQRFTPRRKASAWSKRNREHVEGLMQEGRMQEAGLVSVNEAKNNGHWDAAYAPQSEMEIPDDFLAEIEKDETAKRNFETLSKSKKFIIYLALVSAKKPETRLRRLHKYVKMLENNEDIK